VEEVWGAGWVTDTHRCVVHAHAADELSFHQPTGVSQRGQLTRLSLHLICIADNQILIDEKFFRILEKIFRDSTRLRLTDILTRCPNKERQQDLKMDESGG